MSVISSNDCTIPPGYVSTMKLYSANPSIVFNETEDVTLYIPDRQPPYNFDQFVWDQEISVEEAISKIEITMYPFKEVHCIAIHCIINDTQ